MRSNNYDHVVNVVNQQQQQQTLCPCCHQSPIVQIRVLPLPMTILEEAERRREKDNEVLSIHNNHHHHHHHNHNQNNTNNINTTTTTTTTNSKQVVASSSSSSLARGSQSSSSSSHQANSIALFNGSTTSTNNNKQQQRAFASSKSSSCRTYRTGRWASEESAYTDKLIKSFDAGLLPLPHGIKLNDFLCDLLSCRTSRLTKKLKNAKLSARTYRSWASGNTTMGMGMGMGAYHNSTNTTNSVPNVGGDIQRAQTLFLKTITPEWVQMELQFNISRMWRTHLANFCLQISYLQLDTKEWFSSLDAVDYIAMSCSGTKLQAQRKRMRSALTEDANAAARTRTRTQTAAVQPPTRETSTGGQTEVGCTSSNKEGVFVGGLPFQRLGSLNNVMSLGQDAVEEKPRSFSIGTNIDIDNSQDDPSQQREPWTANTTTCDSVSNNKMFSPVESSSMLEQSMKHSTSLSSFVELFTPDLQPANKTSRTSSIDLGIGNVTMQEAKYKESDEMIMMPSSTTAPTNTTMQPGSEVDNMIDEAIDSVLESSNTEPGMHGLFLKEISRFLAETNSPFQHVDLWVPMDVSHSDVAVKEHIGGGAMAMTSSTKVTGIIYGGQQAAAASVRLSNAGYITVRASPQIMNRLNEFGMYSKNFSFSPGFGMPGSVYLSKIPSWENNLAFLKPEQFARVGGAKIYGVNTTLCIPINTPIGTMVVSLYSTQNLSRDLSWEKKCIEHLWKLKPEPKWKLTIDVGLKTTAAIDIDEVLEVPARQAPASSPRIGPAKNQSFLIPPSPTATKIPRQPVNVVTRLPAPNPTTRFILKTNDGNKPPSSTPPGVPYRWNAQSLALLLGKYMPLDEKSCPNQPAVNPVANNQDVASNLMSLRLLLLRHSSCLTSAESKMVEVIMGKYQYYVSVNKKEHDVILSIVNDWKQLATSSLSIINEAQSNNATVYNNQQPATKRVNNFGYSSTSSNFGMAGNNNSHIPSPSPHTFIPSAGPQMAPSAQQATVLPTMNQFGDCFSLPLDGFGNNNNLQNIANIASSLAEQYSSGSCFSFDGQLNVNVPRVVSEQGPIQPNTAEDD